MAMVALMTGQVCQALRLTSIGAALDDKPLEIMRRESQTCTLNKIGPDVIMKAQVGDMNCDSALVPGELSQTEGALKDLVASHTAKETAKKDEKKENTQALTDDKKKAEKEKKKAD